MISRTLVELAELVERAEGADRELDAQIWLAVTPGATRRETIIPDNDQRWGWTIDETRDASGRLIIVPSYSASLDAAMSVVPKGLYPGVGQHGPTCWIANVTELNKRTWQGVAKSAPLALVAASLRARAIEEQSKCS